MRLRPPNPRAIAVALLALSCGSGDDGTDDAAEGGTSSTSVSSTSVGSQTTVGSVDGSEGSGTGGPTSCDDDPLVWEAMSFLVGGIAVDASGNVYAGGTTGAQAGGNADWMMASYDADGIERWSTTFNGRGNYGDVANDVAIAASGEIYAVGGINQGEPFGGDAAAFYVYDAEGTEVSGSANDDAGWYTSVATNAGGASLVGGWEVLQGSGLGPESWSAVPTGEIEALALGADDRAAAAGIIAIDGTYHAWAARYDAAGVEVWSETASNPPGGRFTGVVVDGQGRIVAVGRKGGQGETQRPWVRRWSADGVAEWEGPVDDVEGEATDVALASDGSIVVVGWVELPGLVQEPWMRKYGPDDAIVWTRTATPMREEDPDLFESVGLGPDDSVFVAGAGFVRKYCP